MAKTTSKKKAAKSVRKTTKKAAVSEAAMMAQWQAAMTPGPAHKRLDPLVGTFKAKIEFVMAPGAPPMVHEGSSVNRWVLGRRFLEQSYRGTSMGMPFEGIGYTGYDNPGKRFVGTWMDTFATGVMNSVGVGRPTAAKMDFVTETIEPSGKKIVFDAILKIKNRNQHTYEMWTKAPNGKRFRNMIVTYVRA